MAIIGNLESKQTERVLNFFPASLRIYLQELKNTHSKIRQEIDSIAVGEKNERLLAENLKAIEQCYMTTTREFAIIESHRLYIDFQLLIAGEEFMETNHNSKLTLKKDYNEKMDLTVYNESNSLHLLKMTPNDYALFMPEDAHRSTLKINTEQVTRKVVIKIPVEKCSILNSFL